MLTELPIVWLIIGSDNIFNIEVNGAFCICKVHVECAQFAVRKIGNGYLIYMLHT